MKTVLRTLTATLLLAAPAAAQILTENFTYSVTATFPPAGWTINPATVPTWRESSLVTGPTVLTADAAVQTPATPLVVASLSTPTMDFTGVLIPELVFDSETLGVNAMAHNTGNGQSLIYYSTDGGTTFTPVFDYQPAAAGLDSGVTVSLPGLSGEPTVRLQFRYRGDNAHMWAIDNVVVQEGYTGGPLLTLSAAPVAGQAVDVTGSGMTPGGNCIFVFSVNGSGPVVVTGIGTLEVTPPLYVSGTLPLDGSGSFSFTTLIPPGLSGGTLDGHVVEVQAGPTYVISPAYSSNVQ